MKLYVGMKIWKTRLRKSYYIVKSFDELVVILSDEFGPISISRSIVEEHVQECGKVSIWKVSYGA